MVFYLTTNFSILPSQEHSPWLLWWETPLLCALSEGVGKSVLLNWETQNGKYGGICTLMHVFICMTSWWIKIRLTDNVTWHPVLVRDILFSACSWYMCNCRFSQPVASRYSPCLCSLYSSSWRQLVSKDTSVSVVLTLYLIGNEGWQQIK